MTLTRPVSPNVLTMKLLSMAAPLALVGAGQSMLFAGLFRSVLADVPAHLGGIGSGVLITLQQAGLAIGAVALPRFTRASDDGPVIDG